MTARETRRKALDYLARGVEAARQRFDRATGRFLHPGGGWAVTQQDVIYPLALLYATDGTAWRGDGGVLELASRGGDALRDWQDDQGRFEFIKTDGSRWGMTYMCWSMYHWVEAYGLLREALDPARRRRWEEGLRLSFDGSARMLEGSTHTHNIPCWHAMALVRAGELLGEDRYRRVGAEAIARHVAAQCEEGYWPEGGGPTTAYNLIYVHAIGLYHCFTGDRSVLPCLERALDFHLHFTYPDGAAVETVDGRVRYNPKPLLSGFPGFMPFPRGRRLVRFLVDRTVQANPGGDLDPRLATVPAHLPEAPDEEIPQERRDFVSIYHDHALVRRAGPWLACLSGYLMPSDQLRANSRNRWRKDPQNHLSVWHERLGLLVGGGNSKNQPEFSSFEVTAGLVRRLQADAAALATAGPRDTLTLAYGPARCEISTRAIDGETFELSFAAPHSQENGVDVVAGFTLPGLAGKAASASGGPAETRLDPLRTFGASWPAGSTEGANWLRLGGLTLHLPDGGSLAWPVYPVNPYAIDNAAPPDQAVGVVSLPLTPGGAPKRVLLSARGHAP